MNQGVAYELANVMPQAVATGLFVSRCTIQAPTGALDSAGAPTGAYADVSGLVAIQCMDAPEKFSDTSIIAGENRAVAEVESMALRHVLLDDYYSQLSPSTNWGDTGWRAVIDGDAYDIAGAENDSQKTQTRLRLRKVTA